MRLPFKRAGLTSYTIKSIGSLGKPYTRDQTHQSASCLVRVLHIFENFQGNINKYDWLCEILPCSRANFDLIFELSNFCMIINVAL